jgi:hypothetical protein
MFAQFGNGAVSIVSYPRLRASWLDLTHDAGLTKPAGYRTPAMGGILAPAMPSAIEVRFPSK